MEDSDPCKWIDLLYNSPFLSQHLSSAGRNLQCPDPSDPEHTTVHQTATVSSYWGYTDGVNNKNIYSVTRTKQQDQSYKTRRGRPESHTGTKDSLFICVFVVFGDSRCRCSRQSPSPWFWRTKNILIKKDKLVETWFNTPKVAKQSWSPVLRQKAAKSWIFLQCIQPVKMK